MVAHSQTVIKGVEHQITRELINERFVAHSQTAIEGVELCAKVVVMNRGVLENHPETSQFQCQ